MTTPDELARELLDLQLDADPIGATLLGVEGRDHLLPDISAVAEQHQRGLAEKIRVRAMAVDTNHAELEDRLTIAVVVQQAQAMVDKIDARSPEYTVTGNLFAPVAGLLFHLGQVPAGEQEQGEAFLHRLSAIPEFTAAAAQRHREGLRFGRVPVRPLLEDAISHLDDHLAKPDADPLRAPQLPDALQRERDRILEQVVRPALADYREVLAHEISPHARDEQRPGLRWLPDGAEIYHRLVHAHTTTDRSPRELHRLGLDRIAELRARAGELGGELWGERDPDRVLHRLRTDPELFFDDAEEMLTSAREALARADAAAPDWFGELAQQPCEVRAVPSPSESTPIGFYLPPAMDGSRPGVYFANTASPEKRPRFASEVIAFHEVTPGHHLQLGIAQRLTGLPMLRRLGMITAYSEGWGLYTEKLADEMGLYSDDLARLGALAQDLLRATRLVVDTGLHQFGWSRQQALEQLRSSTVLSDLEATSEVDRYIAFPGQALSYLVGRLEIERFREEARQRLGPAFDIRRFHDVVLGHGALPLSTLEFLVRDQLPATSR
ncbi:hypothetical protein GCM10009854_05530 [Saccharopolyspora halophila]|uniref:DUF885 domain-containing protein n=1 Tax=Saccharopolyspora halophila TaxID=405551 RepID=A0ABN3FM69_9PSEU